ncbi:MAG: PAS domain-containing protein [Planctomycetes bacterium]|nr:PAS domain-containing protein [Planctomycetota bacterium]
MAACREELARARASLAEKGRLLEERNLLLGTAFDISALLLGTLDLQRTLDTVLDIMLSVAKARAGWIFLWKGETGETAETVPAGVSPDLVAALQNLPAEQGAWARAIAEHSTFLVSDTWNEAEWPRALREVTDAEKVRSLHTVPIPGREGRFLGAICACYETPRAADPGLLTALQTHANFAAIAIEHALQFERIARERAEFETVLANMPSAVLSVDRHGSVVVFNRAAELLTGFPAPEVIGRPALGPLEPKLPDLVAPVRSCLERGQVTTGLERTLLRGDAPPLYLSISVRPLRDPRTGAQLGAVQLFQDVSTFKELDRMKSDFVANVSHELRTPLAAIKGAVGVILAGTEGPLTPDQVRFLDIVDRNTNRLVRLISDILDLSKMEAGRYEFHLRPCDLADLCKDVVATLQPLAEQRKIGLSVEPTNGLLPITCDEDRIKQAITNLVSNGLKFTPVGGKVELRVVDQTREVEVQVRDNGIGIPREDVDRLFQKFVQLDGGATRLVEGTGLGLAISKEIVQAHGGKIWIDSEPGRGSIFHLSLPRK